MLEITPHKSAKTVMVIFLPMGEGQVSVLLNKDGVRSTLGIFKVGGNCDIFVTDNKGTCILSFMNTLWELFVKEGGEPGESVWYTIETFRMEEMEESMCLLEELSINPPIKFKCPILGKAETIYLSSGKDTIAVIIAKGMGNNVVSWYMTVNGQVVRTCISAMSSDISLVWHMKSLYAVSDYKKLCVGAVAVAEVEKITVSLLL